MPSRPIAKGTSTSAKTSTAGVSSGLSTKEWAQLRARLFRHRSRSDLSGNRLEIASWKFLHFKLRTSPLLCEEGNVESLRLAKERCNLSLHKEEYETDSICDCNIRGHGRCWRGASAVQLFLRQRRT